MESMATLFYKKHYHEKIAPNLTSQQKEDIAKRISNLTQVSPIWQDREKNWAEEFPELKPYINTVLSGLYLVAVMEGILEDLQGSRAIVVPLLKDPKRVAASKRAWMTMRKNGHAPFDIPLKRDGLAMWLLKKWAREHLENQNWQELIDDELTYGEMKNILSKYELR